MCRYVLNFSKKNLKKKHLPIVAILNIVPTTAINKIVPKLSKNRRFGMKYPASKIIGGSMYRKNVLGVSGDTSNRVPYSKITPIITPITISRHDSGKMRFNFGDLWKPAKKITIQI